MKKKIRGVSFLTFIIFRVFSYAAPPGPCVPMVVSAGDTLCAGDTLLLKADSLFSYTWFPFNGLNVSTGGRVSAFPTITTTYTITGKYNNGCPDATPGTTTTYTVTGSNPCMSESKTIEVRVNPGPTIVVSGNVSLCPGNSSILSANGASQYTWVPDSRCIFT